MYDSVINRKNKNKIPSMPIMSENDIFRNINGMKAKSNSTTPRKNNLINNLINNNNINNNERGYPQLEITIENSVMMNLQTKFLITPEGPVDSLCEGKIMNSITNFGYHSNIDDLKNVSTCIYNAYNAYIHSLK
jgi:hypothetical protein